MVYLSIYYQWIFGFWVLYSAFCFSPLLQKIVVTNFFVKIFSCICDNFLQRLELGVDLLRQSVHLLCSVVCIAAKEEDALLSKQA